MNCKGQQINCKGQQINCKGQQINCKGQQINCKGQQINCKGQSLVQFCLLALAASSLLTFSLKVTYLTTAHFFIEKQLYKGLICLESKTWETQFAGSREACEKKIKKSLKWPFIKGLKVKLSKEDKKLKGKLSWKLFSKTHHIKLQINKKALYPYS